MRHYCTHPECRAAAIQRLWWLAPVLGRAKMKECAETILVDKVTCAKPFAAELPDVEHVSD